MDQVIHAVLRSVRSGKRCFEADGSQIIDGDFQLEAKAIVHAHECGYLEKIYPLKESHSGDLFYSKILIVGGLTYAGEKFLEEAYGQAAPMEGALSGLLEKIGSHNIRQMWEKALSRRISDPSGAITASRSLLEMVLRWIVEQSGATPKTNNRELFAQAIETLKINDPENPTARLVDKIDMLMQGVGEVRNKHGDAHGASASADSVDMMDAGLCVNVAGSLVLYLIEKLENSLIK